MIKTTAQEISNQYQKRLTALDRALPRSLQQGAIRVEKEQVKNLSGSNSDAPGSYPIPNRTGNLFRSAGHAIQSKTRAIVFNTATYARAIHDGRPFLDNAVETANPGPHIMRTLSKAILA